MGSFISWVWSFFAGMFSVILLVLAGGSLISLVFAIIGALRGRAKATFILIYLFVCVVASILFRLIFWVSDRLVKPDTLSTILFWSAIIIAALGAIKEIPRMLRTTWQQTNNNPNA